MTHKALDAESLLHLDTNSPEAPFGEHPPYVEDQTWKDFRDELYRLPYDAVVVTEDLIFRVDRHSHRILIEALHIRPTGRPAIAVIDIDGRDRALVATVRPAEWSDDIADESDTYVIPRSGTKTILRDPKVRMVTDEGFRFMIGNIQRGEVGSRGDSEDFGYRYDDG